MLKNFTVKELIIYSLAYCNKLDENGELKETRGNRLRYSVACRIAGGEEKLEGVCRSIGKKLKKLGYDIEMPE